MRIIHYFLILIFLTNCKNQNEEELDFGKKVMNEIFIDLVNELNPVIKTLTPPPPPLPELFFSTKNQKIKDSLMDEAKSIHQKLIDSFSKVKIIKEPKVNKRTLIAVGDSLYMMDSESILFAKKKTNIDFGLLSNIDSIPYKIDLKKLKDNKKYKFEYRSTFPKGTKIWKWRHEKKSNLKGIIGISKIIFDKEGKYGVLRAGITYGKLNGYGGIFIIENTNGKWKIIDFYGMWIS